jgi:hypothetical protein
MSTKASKSKKRGLDAGTPIDDSVAAKHAPIASAALVPVVAASAAPTPVGKGDQHKKHKKSKDREPVEATAVPETVEAAGDSEADDAEVAKKAKKHDKKAKKAKVAAEVDESTEVEGTRGTDASAEVDDSAGPAGAGAPAGAAVVVESFFSGTTFESIKELSKPTLDGVKAMGFETMTRIQSKCIPAALCGKDILGAAKYVLPSASSAVTIPGVSVCLCVSVRAFLRIGRLTRWTVRRCP